MEDLDTDTADGSQTDVENLRGNPLLHSLDPFPLLTRLSGPSRSLLKKYFDQSHPVNLPKDHTTVAFREDQMYNLIRVACDEIGSRHFSSREYCRRDQKWRYTHLCKTDLFNGNVSHFVRDKNGNLLGHLELELELLKFINEELVGIGDNLPFYEDFKASRNSVTPGTQLCLVGDYLEIGGDFPQLRSLWTNVGTFTNHQSLFCDFDWSYERITVSIYVSTVITYRRFLCNKCFPAT